MAKTNAKKQADYRFRQKYRLHQFNTEVNEDVLAALVIKDTDKDMDLDPPEELMARAENEFRVIAAKILLQGYSLSEEETLRVSAIKKGLRMFGRTSKSNISKAPEELESALRSVSKSPELIDAEERLASLRTRHTEVYDKIRSLNSTRGRQIDAHQESQRDREIEKLTEQRVKLETEICETKARRNDLLWPWKLAVGEAARPVLEGQARAMLEHLVAIKKLGASFHDTAIKFPGALGQMVPMASAVNHGWLEFARKMTGEKIL